ncbi:hypothetical protein P7F88_12230 [Vibrio hannami]|uniref:hypothetical protein n=1 Tax=Vibrio hannami TaxID=2717094 RepID=UPI0024107D1B|nr:hypothetical protein [Vibrio hannami]MDG3086812.1 hypothetical protein [Vibrio hannami]
MKHTLAISLSLLALSAYANEPSPVNQSTNYATDAYNSMALWNDAPLYNAPTVPSWAYRAVIVQGIPRGDAAPSWWSDSIIDKSITTSNSWNAITAWFSVFEGEDNTARNVRVAVGPTDIWILRASKADDDTRDAI